MAARAWFAVVLAAVCLAGYPSSAQQPAGIGAVVAVEPDAFGTPLGSSRRTLANEIPVYANERVETGRKAWIQLRFLDATDFRVGANSLATLDKFVFDPDRKAGELTINATRGVFRFVSGTMNKEGYRIVTPNAVISVRGTELLLEVSDAGTRVMVLSGLALLS
ncbi:MAG: FecR domain-containing protein, partial [Alphaproteobacteria bacterium]